MKRISVLACLLATLAGGIGRAETSAVTGSIESPTLTPTLPRTMYLASPSLNGLTGFVAEIAPSEGERPFHLINAGGQGQIGLEDLDAWFYRDITGTGEPCPRAAEPDGAGGESGTVCPGARWVVVVLFSGSRADFRLTV